MDDARPSIAKILQRWRPGSLPNAIASRTKTATPNPAHQQPQPQQQQSAKPPSTPNNILAMKSPTNAIDVPGEVAASVVNGIAAGGVNGSHTNGGQGGAKDMEQEEGLESNIPNRKQSAAGVIEAVG